MNLRLSDFFPTNSDDCPDIPDILRPYDDNSEDFEEGD